MPTNKDVEPTTNARVVKHPNHYIILMIFMMKNT